MYEGWQGNYNKNLEGRKNCECYGSKKIQETNIVFSNWSFFLSFFSLCFFCVHYFSFALLTIIRTTKWQRTHITEASNINKIINCNYEIMAKMKIWRHIKFSKKNYLISSYLGVTLSSRNIKTFASLKYLYAHRTQTSLWWC